MTAARIDVLCCALPAIDDALLARYENLLNAEELQRLHKFRSAAAAKEFLTGRALLRTALAERAQCEPGALQFGRNADGKPALSQPASHWQFNLTHSHDWVAVALCEGGSIGIDVESHRRHNDLPAIARRFFSSEENAWLARCPDSAWLDHFLAIWTLKEAHAKALGCGLAKILSCSSIAADLEARTIELALSDVAVAANVASWLYRLDADSVLAVVAHGGDFAPPRLWRCVPLQGAEPLALDCRARGFQA